MVNTSTMQNIITICNSCVSTCDSLITSDFVKAMPRFSFVDEVFKVSRYIFKSLPSLIEQKQPDYYIPAMKGIFSKVHTIIDTTIAVRIMEVVVAVLGAIAGFYLLFSAPIDLLCFRPLSVAFDLVGGTMALVVSFNEFTSFWRAVRQL